MGVILVHDTATPRRRRRAAVAMIASSNSSSGARVGAGRAASLATRTARWLLSRPRARGGDVTRVTSYICSKGECRQQRRPLLGRAYCSHPLWDSNPVRRSRLTMRSRHCYPAVLAPEFRLNLNLNLLVATSDSF